MKLDLTGTLIGGYLLTRRLGAGAMGAVYLAEHQTLHRRAAAKVLLAAFSRHREAMGRFYQEALAISQLRHPNIVELIDFSQLPDGPYYLFMEYIPGDTLAEHLHARRRLTVGETVDLLAPIADALDAIHALGVVHRDLKPANLVIDQGPPRRIKLLDFGVAKLLRPPSSTPFDLPRTIAGTVIGTPRYMSPEQGRGEVAITPAADLYTLGVIAYECLTGRTPFVARTPMEFAMQHNHEPPPPMTELAPLGGARRPVEDLVLGCLAKRPQDRPPSARALAAALRALTARPGPGADAPTLLTPEAATMRVRGLQPPPSPRQGDTLWRRLARLWRR